MPPIEARPGDTRRDPLPLLVLAALLLLLRIGVTVWEQRHPPAAAERLHWVPLERAEALARSSNRPVLYAFSAEWCGPCRVMAREVFASERHATRLATLTVPVHVVDRVKEEGRNPAAVDSLQRAFGVRGFPTLVLYWPRSGRHVSQDGYRGADRVLAWVAQGVLGAATDSLAPPGAPGP